jgi:metal-dependent amidase/aminoacylase/carboxypeptidase family protein
MSNPKLVACKCIDENKEHLIELSQEIWKHPELGFQEYHAHDVLTRFLNEAGYKLVYNDVCNDTEYACFCINL